MGTYYEEVIADAPVLSFKFAETTGTTFAAFTGGINGTMLGSGYTLNQAGPKGLTAIAFNGSSTISLPTTFQEYANTGSYTYEAWAKLPTSITVTYPTMIRRDGNGFATLVRARGAAVGAGFSPNTLEGYTGTSLYSNVTVNDNTWHHVAMVKAGVAMSLYLDGVLVGSNGGNPNIITFAGGTQSFGIGGTGVLNVDENYLGSLAMPCIYNKALTQTRIQAHFNASTVAPASYRGWGIKP